MNVHYTYFFILAASVIGPLALSFDKKIAFYKSWKYLFPAMLIPAAFYIAWDAYFTKINVWSFNLDYITGVSLFGLPIEEILFFFVVPYCCVFIYACIRGYFPNMVNKKWADYTMLILAAGFLIFGIINYNLYYTGWTFIFTGAAIFLIYIFKKYFQYFDAASFLVAYTVCQVPFLLVNGFLTATPVVLYNDAENLGLRIYTIPVEDTFYGMLLILMNVVIFEKLKSRSEKAVAYP